MTLTKNRSCNEKMRFPRRPSANNFMQRNPNRFWDCHVYYCTYCCGFHIGHPMKGKKYK